MTEHPTIELFRSSNAYQVEISALWSAMVFQLRVLPPRSQPVLPEVESGYSALTTLSLLKI